MRVLSKKYWPYQVVLGSRISIDKVMYWCYNTFKSREWTSNGCTFAFKRQVDATMFTLKWTNE